MFGSPVLASLYCQGAENFRRFAFLFPQELFIGQILQRCGDGHAIRLRAVAAEEVGWDFFFHSAQTLGGTKDIVISHEAMVAADDATPDLGDFLGAASKRRRTTGPDDGDLGDELEELLEQILEEAEAIAHTLYEGTPCCCRENNCQGGNRPQF